MQIIRVGIQHQFFLLRDPGKFFRLGRRGDPCVLKKLPAFFIGTPGKIAGHRVIRRSRAVPEIHRKRREHAGRSAVKKQDLIIIRYAQYLAERLHGAADNVIVYFGAVAHLEDGHAAALIIQKFIPCPEENALRKYRRSCREIIDSAVNHRAGSSFI